MMTTPSSPSRLGHFSPVATFLALSAAIGLISPGAAQAQDKIVMVDGVVVQGRILGVRNNSVEIQDAAGVKLPFPLARIRSVEMAEPPELRGALAKLEEGDAAGALPALEKISNSFLGIPTDWARKAVAAYGAALVSVGRLEIAEKTFNDYAKAYGAAGSADAQVGLARIAIEKGRTEEARKVLEPLSAQALGKLHVPAAEGRLYTNVFLLLGRIEELAGNRPAAMENYLRAVIAFPNDAAASADAARRAEALGDVPVP